LENVDMKKIGVLVVAVSLLLSLAAGAAEKAANKGKEQSANVSAEGKAKMRDRARSEGAPSPEGLTKQLASLKQEHQAAMSELQAIKQLAVKEKATQTAAALDKLMAGREAAFQKRIEPLQLRLKKMEALRKGEGKAQKSGEKQRQKGDGAKIKTNP
jgi:hypothetical protein